MQSVRGELGKQCCLVVLDPYHIEKLAEPNKVKSR